MPHEHAEHAHDAPGSTATAVRPEAAPPRVDRLPPWNVLLHNDDVNDMPYVVSAIVELTTLNHRLAIARMFEAHLRHVALLVATHREHAELLQEQFRSKGLTVSIEPADAG